MFKLEDIYDLSTKLRYNINIDLSNIQWEIRMRYQFMNEVDKTKQIINENTTADHEILFKRFLRKNSTVIYNFVTGWFAKMICIFIL